jgi:cell division ATPase FtsA
MVIVVVTVQAVVVVKAVIVWEPSAAKMAGVVCAAEAMRTMILTKPEMVAAKAAQVAGTKTTHVVAAAKATDMATAEASAPHVTAAAEASAPHVTATAEASASHVTAATPSTATRFRCGR